MRMSSSDSRSSPLKERCPRANNLLAEADQVVTGFLTAMNSADNPGGSNFKRFREPMIRRFLRNGLPLAR